MPNDQHSSQGRRPHYHRGRRGTDRRGPERRTPQQSSEQGNRDQADVEQIMRDIRSRIAKRHGIDLSPQQIQELAARRLDAILEPRHVKPALMEQMRRAAGESIDVDVPSPAAEALPAGFAEAEIYESHRGIVRLLRKWLNPVLKLFFNPTPIARALDALTRRNREAAQREAELHARQAEWNALQYEVLQRLVTEVSRASLETQNLAMRVESLATRVDFNERRIRGVESTVHQTRSGRQEPSPSAESPRQAQAQAPVAADTAGGPPSVIASGEGTSGDGTRRRRRRRRGRRSGALVPGEAAAAGGDAAQAGATDLEGDLEGDAEGDETEPAAVEPVEPPAEPPASLEPAHAFSLLQPVERHPPTELSHLVPDASTEPAASDAASPEVDAGTDAWTRVDAPAAPSLDEPGGPPDQPGPEGDRPDGFNGEKPGEDNR